MLFERELVKQRILPDAAFPHHQTHSDPPDRIESAQPTAGNSLLLQWYRPKADPPLRPCNRLFMPHSGHWAPQSGLPQDGWKRTFRPGRRSQYLSDLGLAKRV